MVLPNGGIVMIKARRNLAFEWMMRRVTLPQIRKQFETVYWSGTVERNQPAIYIANHSSWWDGLLYFHLRHTVIDRTTHIMMHETGLRKFWYFRYIGAYSVNKTSRRDIIEALSYSKELISQGNSVWIFPQGDEFSQEKRPLELESGVIHLMQQLPDVPIIPLTTYYWFGHHKKAEVAVHAGQPLTYQALVGTSRKEKLRSLEVLLEHQLDQLKQDVVEERMERYQRI